MRYTDRGVICQAQRILDGKYAVILRLLQAISCLLYLWIES